MRKYIKTGVIILLILLRYSHAQSQPSRVDSALSLLAKCKTVKGIDSAGFVKALDFIAMTDLTDADIVRLENTAKQLKSGDDMAPVFLVKYMITRSLYRTDKNRSIQYGKAQIEELGRSKRILDKGIRNSFLSYLRVPYRESDQLAEGLQYYTQKLNEAKKDNDSTGISICYYVLGGFYRSIGLYEPALYNMKKSVSYIDTMHNGLFTYYVINVEFGVARWINNAGLVSGFYTDMGDYEEAERQGLEVLKVALHYAQKSKNANTQSTINATFTARHVVEARLPQGKLDSIEYYLGIAERSLKVDQSRTDRSVKPYYLQLYARYCIQKGDYTQADSLLQEAWDWVKRYQIGANQPGGITHPDYYLAQIQVRQANYNEAIRLLQQDIERIRLIRPLVLKDYRELAVLYEKTGRDTEAKNAYKSFISLQDSLLSDQSAFRTISFETEQQITENEIAIASLENANKLSAQSRNFTIGIAALLLVLAGSIYYRFHAKKKANAVLKKTLAELKTMQSQLIQSEKMASLGELTAGIAHEIQNPLNFVNNFSEVSHELVDEMTHELDKGGLQEARAIATDLKQNLEKINHHGKRADAIVKGMLQHSRSGSRQKESTDINALCDEYLRLAYHGMRARDSSFNAKMETDFDQNSGRINVLPQDLGRVILNLINNAFYAVAERKKRNEPGYEPVVSIQTKRSGDMIEIRVKDNGTGIPQHVLDKIFQPFFTTKPTGQGTGLGLSLSYDIVAKGHGGELKVETAEGKGTEFHIHIPV